MSQCEKQTASRATHKPLQCPNLATVKRNGVWYCPDHDPNPTGAEYVSKRKKPENKWRVGQWVRLYNGRAGQIVKIAPPCKPGVTVQVNKSGTQITVCKSTICDLTNTGHYQDAGVPHLQHRRKFDNPDFGRHPADWEDDR